MAFKSTATADDEYAVLAYNGTHTFMADEASYGLTKANAPLNVVGPWWYTYSTVLNIASGTYQFASVNLNTDGTYGGTPTLNVNGGMLKTPYVSGNGGALVLNGGTLSFDKSDYTDDYGIITVPLTIGANGGTINTGNGELRLAVSGALSGSGTITKTGTRPLAFTGDTSAFTGTITVAAGAGEVTINGTTIPAGESKSFDAVYKVAWRQDFEDASTYASNLKEGSVASAVLGTSASEPKDVTYTVHAGHYEYVDDGKLECQISYEERTAYDSLTSSHCLRGVMRAGTSANLMFMMPSEATTATDYIVEFDHYLGPSYTNGSNTSSNGFVIVGANGILASFAIGPVDRDGPYNVSVYRGDDVADVLTTSIRTGTRGTVDEADWWMHVTVRGTADGIFMSVANANASGHTMAEVKLQDDFDVVEAIYIRNTAKQYKHGFSLDDVVVSLPATATTYTWTGAAGDGFWTTAGNWLAGDDVPLTAPTSLDEVVIPPDSGDVYISPDVAYGSLSVGTGARLGLLVSGVTEEATVFTLPELKDGSTLSVDQVVLCGPYEMGVTGDGTAVTAKRVPSSFTWAVSSGAWQTPSNWTVGGLASGDTPGPDDQVVFPSTATCTVNTDSMAVSNVVVNSDAVLTVTGNKYIYALMFNGEGSLRLAGGLLGNVSGKYGVISNNIEVVEGTTNDILVGNGGGYQISFYGNLSGSGNLRIDENGQNSAGLNLYSEDNSSFSGVFEVYRTLSSAVRSNTRFFKAGATSAAASWTLRGKENSNIFQESNKTYYFGALNNGIYEGSSYSGIVLEIGARNEDCAFSGCASRFDDATHKNFGTTIRKVGTAKLTIDTTNTGTVEINGGTFAFAQASALPNKNEYGDYWIEFGGGTLEATGVDPSALIIKSRSAVSVFVGAETNETWASAIADSNTGGFAKYGAGTLTLSEKPLYTGITSIMDGKIVFPAQLDATENKEIVLNPLSAGTYENAILTGYAYPAGTVLDGTEEADDVRNEFAIDVAGVAKVDLSAANETIINALKTDRQWILASSAEGITGFRRGRIELVMPAKPEDVSEIMWQWTVGVVAMKGGYALAVIPESNPTRIIIR